MKLIGKSIFVVPLVAAIFLLTACGEIKTSDAKAAYKNWAGANVPKDIKVMNGQYWQSGHWTKEYIVYLKFRASSEWRDNFIAQNNIVLDKGEWTAPSDAPKWFGPSANAIRYSAGEEGSRYFMDTATGIIYIYEIQL